MKTGDSRIPVLFVPQSHVENGDALLVDASASVPSGRAVARLGTTGPGHAAGCNCCVWRSGAAQAMTALFHARARGEVPLFTRLVVALDEAGAMQVRTALQSDRFVAARYCAAMPLSRTSSGTVD